MSLIIKGREIVLNDYAQITATIEGSSKTVDVYWYLEKVDGAVYPYDEYHPIDYILSVYSHILEYTAGSSYPMDRMFFFMMHNDDYKYYSDPENIKATTKLTNIITNTPIYTTNSNNNIRFSGCTTFSDIAEKADVSVYEKFNGIPESKYEEIMNALGSSANNLIVDTPHIQTAIGDAVTTLSNTCYLYSETDQITVKLKYPDEGEIVIPTYIGGFDIDGEVGIPKYVTTSPSLVYYSLDNISNYVDITEYPQAALNEIKDTLDNLEYYELTSGDNMFSCSKSSSASNTPDFQTLDLTGLDISKIYSMNGMFRYCSNLTTLDVSSFDTSNVTNMSDMFYHCSNLTALDVSNFDTSKVVSMSKIFSGCSNLTTLDVSNFDTSKVTNMSDMFYQCYNLTTLDVSNFNTSNVTNMNNMFNSCSNLTTLDVSNFNTSNVTNMSSMFSNCTKTTLDVSNFDTSKVINMSSMFHNCTKLATLDVSNFNTSNVTNIRWMFRDCSNLTTLDVSNFNTSKVTDMGYMFANCSKLTTLDVSNFNTSNVTKMDSMFSYCTALNNLKLNFDMSSITNANMVEHMFSNCTINTGSIKFTNVKTSVFTNRATFINKISGSGISDSILTVNFV